jgi:hypothetical protein
MVENVPIVIRTYDELLEHEPGLLARISSVPNGGQLYLLHPLLLLADIGADLAPQVQEEFAARHGATGGWSDGPYRALRESTGKQPQQVTLRGLFRRPS